jgi:hypothetical protein
VLGLDVRPVTFVITKLECDVFSFDITEPPLAAGEKRLTNRQIAPRNADPGNSPELLRVSGNMQRTEHSVQRKNSDLSLNSYSTHA